MKVLVTGGCGYIGSVAVFELLSRGYAVKIIDKMYFGNEHFEKANYGTRIEVVQGDIRNFEKSILDDVDAVIHLAGLSNDPMAEFNPKANFDINVTGTKALALACIEKKIKRFIYASSASIYDTGLLGDDIMQGENIKVEPLAAYSKSKYDGERVLLELAKEHQDFCPIILRQGTVFGQSPRMRYDLVVNTMVKNAFTNGRIKVFCGGTQWRPLIDVKDLARAYIACLEAPENLVKREIFNVSFDNFRILDVAHRIKESLKGIKQIEVDVDYTAGRIDRSYRISNKKIEDRLGFRHRISIEQSSLEIAKNIKHFLDNNGIAIELDHPKFYNIKWLEHLVDMEKRIKAMGGNVF